MKTCSTCKWFKFLDLSSVFGQCYYHPPVAFVDRNVEQWSLRPSVEADDKACSKWSMCGSNCKPK